MVIKIINKCVIFHKNKTENTAIGKIIIEKIIKNSIIKRAKNNTKSASITKVFIKIPIPMEKPTNPSLYSFFQGLK